MTQRSRRFVQTGALLAVAGLAACTNSDPLAPQPGNLEVVLETTPGGAAGFDNFNLAIVQVGIEPVGGEAAFGASIGTLVNTLQVNLAPTAERSLGSIVVPAGNYRVGQFYINFTQVMFQELSPVLPASTCDASNCLQYVAYRNSSLSDPSDPDSPRFNGRIPAPELAQHPGLAENAYRIQTDALPPFTVAQGQARRVTVIIDGAGLAEHLAQAYTCRCTGVCVPASGQNVPAPCLSNFTKPSDAEILSFVTVE
jgi:hypothetical protein